MANSCGGGDACVPAEIEVALKNYIRRQPNHRKFFDHTDQSNDYKYSCLLEDCGGKRCPNGKCYYNGNENDPACAPTGPNYTAKKHIW